jgi:5-methylthioadenosine/S-adenosylhomocysteine deaminase
MIDVLIHNGVVLTMDEHDTIHDPGAVAIREGRIVAVGHLDDVIQPSRNIMDATDCVVMPGLVDAHMHETLLRGFCEDLPLDRWLNEICFPKDKNYGPEHMRAAALLNQLEMIRGGITTFIDIFRFPAQAAAVAEQSGLRAIFSPQIIETIPGAGETIEDSERFVAEWHGRAKGRIHAWFGPHTPYTVSAEAFQHIAGLADRYGVGMHTHLAETSWEVDDSLARHGVSPVAYLDGLGVLRPNTLAAHCVWLGQEDIRILAERDVAVAYNPTSNAKLASGVAPVPDLLAAGVRVGLGTDSNLSNNNLDMFEEMRMGGVMQKLHRRDAASMPCNQMLRMATMGSASALGLASEIGSLEPGKKADIILVDLRAPHLRPLLRGATSNVIEQLVYSANSGDVRTTIVDGQVLMKNRMVQTLDPDEVLAAAQDAATDLLQLAGLSEASPT